MRDVTGECRYNGNCKYQDTKPASLREKFTANAEEFDSLMVEMLSENDLCDFCADSSRTDSHLCVVENTQDVYLIDNTHEFHGRYFVLGNLLSPLDGIGPQEINFSKLLELIKNNGIEELILALNPSAEGESTISYIASQLEELPVRITRLSTGLPFGGDIEYTSSLTLGNALKRRYSVK